MQYDLLLTGGEVIDPGAGLRGVMDVAIAGGKIAAVAPSLPANQALRTISAKGRLVMPGLVDMHAHVLINGHEMGIQDRRDTSHRCGAAEGDRQGARGLFDGENLAALWHGAGRGMAVEQEWHGTERLLYGGQLEGLCAIRTVRH